MSGHSHYHNIAAQKAKTDTAKGKIFSRLGKEITIVVKSKGKDPNTNPTLRTLIGKAKAAHMPQDNINRAIAKGAGELSSDEQYIESTYETIKSSVSIVVKTLATNNNRVVAKINEIFKRNGVELSKPGSASRNFERLGILYVKSTDEDSLMNDTLEFGADDFEIDENIAVIKCQPNLYDSVLENFKTKYEVDEEESSVCLYPTMKIDVDDKTYESIQKLIDMLEEYEDVQVVYDNRQ